MLDKAASEKLLRTLKAEENQADQGEDPVPTLFMKDRAIECCGNAIAFAGLGGNLTYVNRSFLELWGYVDKQEVLRQPLVTFWENPERARQVLLSLRGEKSWNGELVAARKDGSVFDAHVSAIAISDGSGRSSCLMVSVFDVTERKRSEETLKRQADLVNLIHDAILVRDMDDEIVFWNRGAENTYGWTRDEAMGKVVHTLLQTHFPKPLEEIEADLLRYGRWEGELLHAKRDGTQIVTASRWALERDENGKPSAVMEINSDVTMRKKNEEMLFEAQKLESIGILAGGIAHDFNNILTAILGNLELAEAYATPGDKVFKKLQDALRASLQAKDLTAQLLTFAKGGAPVKKPVSTEILLRKASSFALRGSAARCDLSVSDDLWPIEADESQIAQVINNLLINAAQSMPAGGVVKVQAENTVVGVGQILPLREGNYVRITVRDRGIGIPEKHLPRIFHPYFSTKQKGSGLGLATSYSIVKNHDSALIVESEVGIGTAVFVYLPASRKDTLVAKAQDEELIGEVIPGHGRILVMDDEELVRDVAGSMLTHMGYEVEYASDGIEAIRLYQAARHSKRPFAAVIMDLTIPGGMGGKEAIAQLLKKDPEIRAVVSSGYSDDPIMSHFSEYGFRGVIAKPYKMEELGRTLQQVLADKAE